MQRWLWVGPVMALACVGCDGRVRGATGQPPTPPELLSFSATRGFYTEPFDLVLTTPVEGATLAYTLDGSDPRESSARIQGASPLTLTIDPTDTDDRFTSPVVIVRAVVLLDDVPQTLVVTHSYLFVDQVTSLSPDDRAPGSRWPAPTNNGQRIDYGMDPDVYNDSVYRDAMVDALRALPSVIIATDVANLFDRDTGIYVNASERGAEWERPASLEILHADALPHVQIDAGLRIRGGYSRSDGNPKHAFRLFFRSQYGARDLRFPLFGSEGADTFDKVDLRTGQNYSWSYRGDSTYTFVRDVFARDTQRDLGQPYTRSRYYHLYLNGVYWGLFQTQERAEARYAASYLGGHSDDYDVVKVAAELDYVIEATDGDLSAWREVYDRAVAGFSEDANYYALEGRSVSGARDTRLPVWVDIDSLIDYMLVIFYTGNIDAPVSKFLTNQKPNNFYAIRNRVTADRGFVFFAHDSEHTLFGDDAVSPHGGIAENRVTIGQANGATNGDGRADDSYRMRVTEFSRFHPQWLHHRLMDSALYRARFAARAHQLLDAQGPLSPTVASRRMMSRAEEIEVAVIAESARWGDANRSSPRTRDDDWRPAVDAAVTGFFPGRTDVTIEQLRAVGLY